MEFLHQLTFVLDAEIAPNGHPAHFLIEKITDALWLYDILFSENSEKCTNFWTYIDLPRCFDNRCRVGEVFRVELGLLPVFSRSRLSSYRFVSNAFTMRCLKRFESWNWQLYMADRRQRKPQEQDSRHKFSANRKTVGFNFIQLAIDKQQKFYLLSLVFLFFPFHWRLH